MREKQAIEILEFIFEFITNPENQKAGEARITIASDFGEPFTLYLNNSHTHSTCVFDKWTLDDFITELHRSMMGAEKLSYVKQLESKHEK